MFVEWSDYRGERQFVLAELCGLALELVTMASSSSASASIMPELIGNFSVACLFGSRLIR